MYSKSEIFCDDYQALQQILDNPTPRNIRGASAIIRRFFLDDPALVHVVNRERRMKLLFRISKRNIAEDPIGEIFGKKPDFIFEDPAFIETERVPVKQDEFLGAKSVEVMGTTYSTKDIILYFANQIGGVHVLGKGDDPYSVNGKRAAVNGIYMGAAPMINIVRIVLEALEPLYFYLRA